MQRTRRGVRHRRGSSGESNIPSGDQYLGCNHLLESNTASTLLVRLQWDWGESMQARVLERAAYVKTVKNSITCDCGCNQYPKAWTDATGRVACEPVPDCNW